MRLSEKRTAPLRSMLSVVALSCWVLSAQAQGTSAAEPTGAASLKQVFSGLAKAARCAHFQSPVKPPGTSQGRRPAVS
jgi:hypothetical protein